MKITLNQWQTIELARRSAKAAVDTLESVLIDTMQAHFDNKPEANLLVDLLKMAEDANFQISRIDSLPQSEWMGGDSSDAKNFKVREPHCVPMPRGYLKDDNV